MLDTSFRERYASLSDDELLHIAGDRRDLLEEACIALDAEMARRGLTHKQARAKRRDSLRLDIEEARPHRQRRNQSKYFVTQMNLGACFIGLAIGVALLMIFTPSHGRFPDEWLFPLVVVYLGGLIACLAVQPWVRETFSFWICLAISFVPQFFVARWLTVYHPSHSRSGDKGSAILSMLAGYLVGGALFLLMQKLKPSRPTEDTDG
jgi:hypothetical protein